MMALAIGVAAVAVAVVLVLGFVILPRTQPGPPAVVLSVGAQVGPTGIATVKVDSASVAYPPSFYRVTMAIGATNGSSQPMPSTSNSSVYVLVANTTFGVRWTDWDGGGRLTAGDTFAVTPLGGPTLPAGQALRFWLLQSSNATVASVGWLVPGPRPYVLFGSLSVLAQSVTFQVLASSTVVPIAFYWFDLYVNSTHASSPVTLRAGTNQIVVGARAYWVNYTDVGGNGNLKAGDVLKLQPQPAGSSFAAGAYTFYLIWAADGGTVQSEGWSVYRPVVTFGSLSVNASWANFQIAGTSIVAPISSYRFNLAFNGTAAPSSVPFSAGVNQITLNGTTYWVNYTDVGGTGNLMVGDFIRVQPQPAGAFFASGVYEFILIWAADGGVVQTQSWSV